MRTVRSRSTLDHYGVCQRLRSTTKAFHRKIEVFCVTYHTLWPMAHVMPHPTSTCAHAGPDLCNLCWCFFCHQLAQMLYLHPWKIVLSLHSFSCLEPHPLSTPHWSTHRPFYFHQLSMSRGHNPINASYISQFQPLYTPFHLLHHYLPVCGLG